jgi:hypothetical protein
MSVIDSIGKAIEKTGEAFDRNFTSKEEVLDKVKEAQEHILNVKQSIILAEANGSKMQRNWRPFLMYLFGSIIAYKITLAPVLLHFFSIPEPVLVPDFWETIRLAMGGYVIGRTAEKVAPTVAAYLPTVAEAAKKAMQTGRDRRAERRAQRRQARRNERKN